MSLLSATKYSISLADINYFLLLSLASAVSEFLQIETVRLCEVPDAAADAAAESTGCADQGAGPATRGAAAAVPLRVRKETARASLAALGIASRAAELRQLESAGQLQQHQQRQLLSQLPLFSLHDPQHGDCVGSQVLVCPASVGSGFATEASAAEAAAEDDEEAGAGGRKGSALLIRQYESRCLSSDFVDCDLSSASCLSPVFSECISSRPL